MTLRLTAGLLLLAVISGQPCLAAQSPSSGPAQRICDALVRMVESETGQRQPRLTQERLKQLLPLLDLLLDEQVASAALCPKAQEYPLPQSTSAAVPPFSSGCNGLTRCSILPIRAP